MWSGGCAFGRLVAPRPGHRYTPAAVMRTARAGWLAWGVVAALGCVACGGGASVGDREVTRVEAPLAPPVETPQLVVLLVIDQLGSWVFSRYLPLLSPDGFMRHVVDDGAVHHVDFPYASTLTAPGHAGIVTGAAPSVHGVSANETLRDGRIVRIVDDGEHPILGLEGVFASPTVLRSPTVADVLKEETEGRAKVASVSFKARAAILTAGQDPDAVFFYEASVPGFTSSAYYTGDEGLPAWFREWSEEHPPDEMLKPWEPFEEMRVTDVCELDDQPGEGGVGLDATFPHDARNADSPYSTVRYTGLTNEYLLSLAEKTTQALEMGRDDVPDLLVLAVSSTDYIGHAFGAESCEYFDNLWRLDQSLAAFARGLEARGRVSYLVTADHGVARLVERSVADENPAHRLSEAELVALVEARLDEAFGAGDWVAGYAHPFVHLTPEAARTR